MSLPHSIHVVSHPLVQHKLSKMRDKETSSANFRRLLRGLLRMSLGSKQNLTLRSGPQDRVSKGGQQ